MKTLENVPQSGLSPAKLAVALMNGGVNDGKIQRGPHKMRRRLSSSAIVENNIIFLDEDSGP